MPAESDQVRLVPIAPSAYGELRDLADRIWRAVYPGIITADQIDYMLERMYSPEAVMRDVSAGIAYRWIETGEARAGFLAHDALRPGTDTFLHKCYVDPGRHRRGIGTSALSLIVEEATASGCTGIGLRVNRENENAISFYRKNGFEILREDCADIGGGYVMDDFILRLAL